MLALHALHASIIVKVAMVLNPVGLMWFRLQMQHIQYETIMRCLAGGILCVWNTYRSSGLSVLCLCFL